MNRRKFASRLRFADANLRVRVYQARSHLAIAVMPEDLRLPTFEAWVAYHTRVLAAMIEARREEMEARAAVARSYRVEGDDGVVVWAFDPGEYL